MKDFFDHELEIGDVVVGLFQNGIIRMGRIINERTNYRVTVEYFCDETKKMRTTGMPGSRLVRVEQKELTRYLLTKQVEQ